LSGNIKKFITKNGLSTQNIELKSNTASFDINAVANTLDVASSNTQLFSINDSNTGVIFSVNNTDELPYIEVQANGDIRLAEIDGKVLIGLYSSNSNTKLQVEGGISYTNSQINSIIEQSAKNITVTSNTKTGILSYPSTLYRSSKLLIHARDTVTEETQLTDIIITHKQPNTVVSNTSTAHTSNIAFVAYTYEIENNTVLIFTTNVANNITEYSIFSTLMKV
jgi:hypothetical protein